MVDGFANYLPTYLSIPNPGIIWQLSQCPQRRHQNSLASKFLHVFSSLTFTITSLMPPTFAATPKPKILPALQSQMPVTHFLTAASENSPSHHMGSLISFGYPAPWPHYVLWTYLHSKKTTHYNLSFKSLFKNQLELFF